MNVIAVINAQTFERDDNDFRVTPASCLPFHGYRLRQPLGQAVASVACAAASLQQRVG